MPQEFFSLMAFVTTSSSWSSDFLLLIHPHLHQTLQWANTGHAWTIGNYKRYQEKLCLCCYTSTRYAHIVRASVMNVESKAIWSSKPKSPRKLLTCWSKERVQRTIRTFNLFGQGTTDQGVTHADSRAGSESRKLYACWPKDKSKIQKVTCMWPPGQAQHPEDWKHTSPSTGCLHSQGSATHWHSMQVLKRKPICWCQGKPVHRRLLVYWNQCKFNV